MESEVGSGLFFISPTRQYFFLSSRGSTRQPDFLVFFCAFLLRSICILLNNPQFLAYCLLAFSLLYFHSDKQLFICWSCCIYSFLNLERDFGLLAKMEKDFMTKHVLICKKEFMNKNLKSGLSGNVSRSGPTISSQIKPYFPTARPDPTSEWNICLLYIKNLKFFGKGKRVLENN